MEKPSEQIRRYWDEMKELKRCREGAMDAYDNPFYLDLEKKFEEIEILFGRSDSLSKAIIYYLDEYQSNIFNLIVDEILICHKEGTPTSRLTSLANKIKNI